MTENAVAIPPGIVAITTYGSVCAETTQAYGDMRAWCITQGLTNIAWHIVHGTLVDKARNDAAEIMLREPAARWLFFLDADMIWQPDLLGRILQTAFAECPWAGIVGGWCPQKGAPYLPTIDLGSGTWEPIAPLDGNKEVMRTGAACVLIKREVFEKMERPWYGVRPAPRPIDMVAEVDNFCNQIFDGENPFRKYKEWNQLEQSASSASNGSRDIKFVGEDSGICDKARAMDVRIVVNTHAVCDHVHREIITATSHLEEMRKLREQRAAAVGVLP